MGIEQDYYWQSAQKLGQLLGKCIRIGPDDEVGLRRIPADVMRDALREMCATLSYMEADETLYSRLHECNAKGEPEIRAYLKYKGMNIDELFSRFVQFEEAVIRDAKINYDFGRIMMYAVGSKRGYLYEVFSGERPIDVAEVRANVASVRREVCWVTQDYHPDSAIDGFIWGRLFNIAGVKIAVNSAVLVGGLQVTTPDLSVAVGAYMSEMAGGAMMMFRSQQ